MSSKKPIGLGLISVVVAMLAMAFAASSAFATTIKTAGHEVEIVQTTNQTFTPSNGTSETIVTCTGVTAFFTIPGEPNNSLENGSVRADFSTRPTYTGCSTNIAGTTTTVATTGGWSLDAFHTPNGSNVITVAVPQEGAVITVENVEGIGTCTLTVSPTGASAVSGSWTNGTNSEGSPSTAAIKEQVSFSPAPGACGAVGTSPAVYQGTVKAVDQTDSTKPVKIEA